MTIWLDTETSGLHPDDGARVASVGLWKSDEMKMREDEIACFPFDHERGITQGSLLEESGGGVAANLSERTWEVLLVVLGGNELIGHHMKFDCTMLQAGTQLWGGVDLLEQVVWDTQIAQQVLDPLESAGLEATCARLGLGQKLGDSITGYLASKKLPRHRYDLVPWDIMEPYLRRDVWLTVRLWDHQQNRLASMKGEGEEAERRREIENELMLMKTLARMEWRGLGYDVTESDRIADRLEAQIARLVDEIPFRDKRTGEISLERAKAWFYGQPSAMGARRVKPGKTTKNGAPSLDEEERRRLVRLGGEVGQVARTYDSIVKRQKAVSMWYRGYPNKIGRDGRLRCVYRQGHVVSGRLSVERLNLQAIPKRGIEGEEEEAAVRKLLKPAENKQLWSLDLSQAELRLAAHMANCRSMLQMLKTGIDLHAVTAVEVMGVVKPSETVRYEDGQTEEEWRENWAEWKHQRDIAKRLTFGSIFQIGGETFQKTLAKIADIEIEIEEAERLVWAWRRKYPEFTRAFNKAEELALGRGYVRLAAGTELEKKSWLSRGTEGSAWSRAVQGSLAEFVKHWLRLVDEKWPGTLVLTVHDSIVMETSDAKQVRDAAIVALQESHRLFGVDIPCEVEHW